MLILFLAVFPIVFIECRCLASNKAVRAIDGTENPGPSMDQYVGSMNDIGMASLNELETGTTSNIDDISQKLEDKLTFNIADDKYPPKVPPGPFPVCPFGQRLACCKPPTPGGPRSPAPTTTPGETLDSPDEEDIACIWKSVFDPQHIDLHDWEFDWCMDQNLACCENPNSAAPVWSECESLGLPYPPYFPITPAQPLKQPHHSHPHQEPVPDENSPDSTCPT